MDEQKQQPTDDETNEPQLRGRLVNCEAFEQLLRFREELIKETNGHIFEDSAEILRQEREKRTRHLMQVFTGQYDDEEESTTTEQIVPDEANVAQQHPILNDFLEQVHRIREQVIEDSKGELFEDSTEMIRQMREERTKQRMQAISGQYEEDEANTTEEQS